MTTKLWAAVMVLFTLVYVVLLGQKGVVLILIGEPLPVIMGLAILAFPLFAVWALYAEIRFGIKAEALAKKAHELGIPELELQFRPSGRATKESAKDALALQLLVPDKDATWMDLLRLGQAYDASGERKIARATIRKAILLADNAKAL